MSFPSYLEYKDSGVEWLGEVPLHWQIKALRYLSVCLDGKRIPLNGEQRADKQGDIPYWGANAIMDYVDEAIFDEELLLVGEDGAPFLDPLKPVAFHSSGPVWPNNHIHVLRPNKPEWVRFLVYAMNAADYANYIEGSTRQKLNQSRLMGIPVSWPSYTEQTQIARFLDHETARIDALIEEQQRLIELLKEKRQALISLAVTKGLDPTVPMKDSGVEWLGEVPAHWTVSPLKFLVEEKVAGPYGASLTKAMYTDSGYRVYGQQQVISDDFSIGDYYISEEKFSEMQRYVVFPGDVLVSVMGTIGRVSVVPFGVEVGIINPRLVRYKFSSSKVTPEFVKILLMSLRYQSRLREESQGSTMEGLNMVILGDLPLVLPPLDIQRAIVSVVKDYDLGFEELVGHAESAVALLQERRSALISAAVTGKIDVRGWQPPASATPPELAQEAV
ncbi:restriction endonuclease subunit S [Pseudomonas protegens]|uniref:restriction endonuclease subunit S n=1 Tax=Pseudomonas protegens TaxID=380021 RepID=UPI0023ED5E1A|nr:restriction endonuclease subunit S [Pseudomonas protegens]MDF4206863.1 restriction endonuclease subunit S [Pseudomonas protegens]